MNKNILTLDLATSTGWATLIDGKINSGVQDFSKKRGESNGIMFLRFNAWLREMQTLMGTIHIIGFEQAHHRGGYATEIGVGLSTRVEEFAAEIKAEHISVHTSTLKKFITGSGIANKRLIMDWFKLKMGREPITDDESDALAILYYTMNEIGETNGN